MALECGSQPSSSASPWAVEGSCCVIVAPRSAPSRVGVKEVGVAVRERVLCVPKEIESSFDVEFVGCALLAWFVFQPANAKAIEYLVKRR